MDKVKVSRGEHVLYVKPEAVENMKKLGYVAEGDDFSVSATKKTTRSTRGRKKKSDEEGVNEPEDA